jgi:hypothetical protein
VTISFTREHRQAIWHRLPTNDATTLCAPTEAPFQQQARPEPHQAARSNPQLLGNVPGHPVTIIYSYDVLYYVVKMQLLMLTVCMSDM